MIRRILLVASACAIPLAGLAVTSSVASGSSIDVTHDTIACSTFTGSLKFSPPLVSGGSASSDTITVKGALSNCTDGSSLLTGATGKLGGTLTGTSNNCLSLLGSQAVTGSLTIKWKTTPKSTPTSSVDTPNSTTGVTAGADGNSAFVIPGSTPSSSTGAFQGNDNGASGSAYADTGETPTQLGAACAGKGIKKLTLVEGAGNLSHLNLG
ncbi:MAG TPA: hypothetical protein VKG43_14620 [Acidimicrobiales bacterium]|nr:hypothetical protein [Acidimicrobiales bacterium]